MDLELERENERQKYQLCQLGFAMTSLALIVACLTSFLDLPRLFAMPALLPWVKEQSWWGWVDTPVVWGSLVGTYFLWSRWKSTSWQRRTGLLLAMCGIDMVLWSLDHAGDIAPKLATAGIGHEWLRHQLGQALGWAEFALMASLACDVLVHLGIDQAAETAKATRSLAATGAVVWIALFMMTTDWRHGWPLITRGIRSLPALLLFMGSTMIWTITLVQVTALSIAATRQCTLVLREMEREAIESDPLRLASESDFRSLHGFEQAGEREF